MPGRLDHAFLRQVSLLKEIDEPTLQAFWPNFQERRLRKGEVLFRAGEAGDELYVIRSGNVVVSKPVTGRVEQVLRHLGPGEVFGEMCVFGDEQRRSATIQAETDVSLLSLHRDALSQFIESRPREAAKLLLEVIRVAFVRLRDTSDLVAEVTRWGLEATGLDVEHK
jgi:CRP-like cAMP-binding protein